MKFVKECGTPIFKNSIFNESNLETMNRINPETIDLVVTSPPYDGLREYNGYSFDFESVANNLFRVLKVGGVVVWVVGDATKNGSESGTSFRQALYFKSIGFNIHDTMIYQKNSLPKNHNRYEQDFEYMFVFSKGSPKTFNPIRIPTLFQEKETSRENSYFSKTNEKGRSARSEKKRNPVGLDKIMGNIWKINAGSGHSTLDKEAFKHPAIFPEKLVLDHLNSWSNEGDLVYDPFMGSGTTAKICLLNKRNFLGSEISLEYCKIAEQRLLKHSNQGDLFI